MGGIVLHFCNSECTPLVRAADIVANKISSKRDIDISILTDIMLIFNIGNIDIDINIYFTTFLWGGEAPHNNDM